MPQPLLAAADARRHPVLGVRVAPGRDTLRRVIEAVDAAMVDRLVSAWLATRLAPPAGGCGLAVDGKTVRHSGGPDGVDVQLFAAMRHDTAVVVAQVLVPAGTTEVTQIRALLDHTEIAGTVITADAAHPSGDTATYLRNRGADYVFTVKGNRPALLAAITDRLPAATPATSAHTDAERRSGYRVTRTISDGTRHRRRLPRRGHRVPAPP
ncbi:ISAs1 family transposase [Micromonospora sp. LOL_013]|uniref:ISAs1 family transposase n=2 Tax=unclassified Micromonospora TaxID=2617518 RepID=UPI003A88B93D